MVQPPLNILWLAKSEFLKLVCPTAPTPDLSIILGVLSGFGQVMCGADQVSAIIVPATHMTEHAKK